MQVGPADAEAIVLATLSLHNFLRKSKSRQVYSPVHLVDQFAPDGTIIHGNWHNESYYLRQLSATRLGNNPIIQGKEIREAYKEYFFNEGVVPWQWNSCMDVS